MSAEKLRALHEAILAPDVDDMDSIHTLAAKATVLAALPQIVALVEAAEYETEYDCINGVGHYELTERGGGDLGRALAALDEALSPPTGGSP